jgi:hypothetical protein
MPWTFDRFEAGQALGRHRETLDEASVREWLALFPGDRDFLPWMPPGLAIALVMRAYMHVLAERPPGNVHAGQDLEIVRLAEIGSPLTTALACAERTLAKGRRRIAFEATTTGDDGAVFFRSRVAMIWAA